jgi:hypothetical protein
MIEKVTSRIVYFPDGVLIGWEGRREQIKNEYRNIKKCVKLNIEVLSSKPLLMI